MSCASCRLSDNRFTDVNPAELAEMAAYRGVLRLGLRFWRFGLAEMWRDVWRPAFAASVRRYVPEIGDEDLGPGPSGVRAQSVRIDGEMVDDFSIGGSGRVLHVRNAPSPAISSPASTAAGRGESMESGASVAWRTVEIIQRSRSTSSEWLRL